MKKNLHIGGKQKKGGWEILNAVPGPFVDHVGNANDVSQFENDTFAQIYASHVVEHFDYQDELLAALKGWWRILEPDGKIYISVPDIDVLAEMIISKDKFSVDERFFIMRMLFGGHIDKYDYHVVGLNQDFLTSFLNQAGFINIKKVSDFGLFDDTSKMKFKGVAISLNLIAEKPRGDHA